jgi:hypothetical protein
MANNRVHLSCSICKSDTFCMLKYYPSTGWYTRRTEDEIQSWLDQHDHGTLMGDYLVVKLEHKPDERGGEINGKKDSSGRR